MHDASVVLTVFVTQISAWQEFSPQEGLICLRSGTFLEANIIFSKETTYKFQPSFTSFPCFWITKYVYAYFQRRKFLI